MGYFKISCMADTAYSSQVANEELYKQILWVRQYTFPYLTKIQKKITWSQTTAVSKNHS